jgi:hypothetical protein
MSGIEAHGCSIDVAVGKNKVMALPSMRTTHAHVVGIAIGDLPPCRHGQRLGAILKYGVIVEFVNKQSHVEVGTVALCCEESGGGEEGGLDIVCACACAWAATERYLQVCSQQEQEQEGRLVALPA